MHLDRLLLLGVLSASVLLSGCGKEEKLSEVPEGLNAVLGLPTRNYKNMILYTRNQQPLNLGVMNKASDELTVNLTNKSEFTLTFSSWRSPCPCMELLETPEAIEPGQTAKLILAVNPENYDGRIVRNIPLNCTYNGKNEILFLPVEFTAGEPGNQAAVITRNEPFVKYTEYTGGGMEDALYAGASAWILSGSDCAECNNLKMHTFPKVFKEGSKIVQVNLDDKAGLSFLLELEKRMGVQEPGDAPVMYFRGQLYYGSNDIKKALGL